MCGGWKRKLDLFLVAVALVIGQWSNAQNVSRTPQAVVTFSASVNEQEDRCALFAINPDGSDLRQLTDRITCEDRSFTWSPDGRQVAFSRPSPESLSSDIWVFDTDGSRITNLTVGRYHAKDPDWSPNGEKIAFSADTDRYRYIYMMDANGSNITQITSGEVIDDSPIWSQDMRYLYFVSNTHPDKPATDPITLSTFSINPDGTDRIEVVRGSSDDLSHDGTALLKTADYVADTEEGYIRRTAVLSVDIDSGHETTLLESNEEIYWYLAVSPHGDQLVIEGAAGIYMMDMVTKHTQLIYPAADQQHYFPVWRPLTVEIE